MKKKVHIISYIVLALLLIFLLAPILWMFITSFKTKMAAYKVPPEWIPSSPTFANYISILKDKIFMVYYINNFIVSFASAALTIILSIFAGYAFSRYKFRGSDSIMLGFLSTQMFPVVGIIIALYTVYRSMNLINNRLGLVLALTSAALPFTIMLMKGFFDDIPKAIEESAAIDGCGRFGTLFRIVLPLSKPGILAIGLYTFLLSWNDYLYCLTLVTKDNLRTLSTGISLRYLGELSYDWSNVMAVSVIGSIPLLIIFIFLQRYMIQGLTAGAVKE